jgi:hypothetical protein
VDEKEARSRLQQLFDEIADKLGPETACAIIASVAEEEMRALASLPNSHER